MTAALAAVDIVRDTQYRRRVASPAIPPDSARPTVARSTREGWMRLDVTDDPGGPWLVRDAAAQPCLWLGADGRVCDLARRYGGPSADVVFGWLLDAAGPTADHPVMALGAAQLSERARTMLGARKLARLAGWGVLAAAPPPESSASEELPRRRSARVEVPAPVLTPKSQLTLFGGPRG